MVIFFEEKTSYLDFVSPVKELLEVKENLWLDISVEISYFKALTFWIS